MKRTLFSTILLGAFALVPARADLTIRELWDNVSSPSGGDMAVGGLGDGTTSVGFQPGSTWFLNYAAFIKVAQNFDVTQGSPDTIPGLAVNAGQTAGLYSDVWNGGMPNNWDTRSWATRQLASSSQINFAGNSTTYFSVRLNNGGDSSGGIGFASAGDGTASFIGAGLMWDNYWPNQDYRNSLFISSGTLGVGDGPVAPVAHGPTSGVNGKVLVVGRLTTGATGNDLIQVAAFQPGSTLPASEAGVTWDATYSFDSSMTATHLMIWMNGTYPFEMDAIRAGSDWQSVVIPEPTVASLALLGLAGFALLRRRA